MCKGRAGGGGGDGIACTRDELSRPVYFRFLSSLTTVAPGYVCVCVCKGGGGGGHPEQSHDRWLDNFLSVERAEVRP